MIGRGDDRDVAVDAMIVDRYLESILSRAAPPDLLLGVPGDVRLAADRLLGELPRHHPSFRFEEELAARLLAVAEGREGALVRFPGFPADPAPAPDRRRSAAVRPVVLGGVLTSAALSLAGAVYVAWRRSHTAHGAMPRAVRAVARARTV